MSNKSLIRRQDGFPNIFTNALRPFGSFFDADDRAFNSLFNAGPSNLPSVNVVEKKNNYEISVAAPGLKKEDFRIEVEGDMLTVSAEKESSKEEKDEIFTRQEFNFSSFSRSFSLPEWVNKDKIDARYEDGLLKLDLPKTETKKIAASRQVAIK